MTVIPTTANWKKRTITAYKRRRRGCWEEEENFCILYTHSTCNLLIFDSLNSLSQLPHLATGFFSWPVKAQARRPLAASGRNCGPQARGSAALAGEIIHKPVKPTNYVYRSKIFSPTIISQCINCVISESVIATHVLKNLERSHRFQGFLRTCKHSETWILWNQRHWQVECLVLETLCVGIAPTNIDQREFIPAFLCMFRTYLTGSESWKTKRHKSRMKSDTASTTCFCPFR